MIELRAGAVRATIVPEAGGRLGSLVVAGTELLVTGDPDDHGTMWGSFPMAPWVGRLAGARFTHDGVTHQLAANLPPDAIHGVVFAQPWLVTSASSANAVLTCALGDGWPLGGRAEQRFDLTTDELRCALAVRAGDRSMPAEIGWHTWFASPGPIALAPTAMYERGRDHLPTGRLVEPRPGPWDDCFVNTRPVALPVAPLRVTVTSDCDHVVVFDELGLGVAVEPQSGPPDAFHLRPRVLAPGASLQRAMSIAWHDDRVP